MATVFSTGDTRPCLDFAGDDGACDGVERLVLPACAQQGKHWQQRIAAKTADKRITGFTAGRLFAKLRDLGELLHQKNDKAGKWPAAHERTPRLVTNFPFKKSPIPRRPPGAQLSWTKDTPHTTWRGEYLL